MTVTLKFPAPTADWGDVKGAYILTREGILDAWKSGRVVLCDVEGCGRAANCISIGEHARCQDHDKCEEDRSE